MKQQRKFLPILFICLFLIASTSLVIFLFNNSKQQAKGAVDEFYTYEQEGDFSSSWQLLHPYMKEKFSKGHYIQDRAHVFMNHFGVTTFSYTIERTEKLKDWKMEDGLDPVDKAYQVEVVQTFKGKYGHFDLHQNVFAAEEEGEWKIMWDYNK
ncbi:hypothetical protein [Halobacillus sp. A5]|uniref:hypothetical protein n=1 Tax=Halobacillus sp. A5 TaxID=2880263 RepID=UPI0020A6B99E|nr:hypothetical protein [Halobacillus sp. A5]MCP3027968.1 hypothetical protein [Halobacillus sp. A5]